METKENSNREIKFRVYIPDHERFCFFRLGDFDYANRYLEMDDYPVQQYTGLKDKNGKEIYEGDIVVYKYTNDEAMESAVYGSGEVYDVDIVEWYEGRYILTDKNILSKHNYLFDFHKDLMVIGNIFENQELLNA